MFCFRRLIVGFKLQHRVSPDSRTGDRPRGQPEAGKALVYFIEDDREYDPPRKAIMLASLDNRWVRATNGNSYFYFSVAPGERRLCGSWQGKSQTRAVAHFTVEAERCTTSRQKSRAGAFQPYGINFGPLDSYEGLLLPSTFPLNTVQLKK
jgi:hypothetical protein